MAASVGGVTTWGVVVGAGSGVGSACVVVGTCASVAVGKGTDVGAGVSAGETGVAEEVLRDGTGGVANSAATVARTRASPLDWEFGAWGLGAGGFGVSVGIGVPDTALTVAATAALTVASISGFDPGTGVMPGVIS